MKLYQSNGSPNSRRVRIYLAEKGIAMPVVPVDLGAREQFSEAYAAINPRRVVPALVLDDGSTIAEVPAIIRYLEETHPNRPLLGNTPKEKAVIAMWERRMEQEGFAAVMETVRNGAAGLRGRAIAGPHGYDQIPELIERGRRRIADFYGDLETRLAEVPFLAGDEFSVADITAVVAIDFATKALNLSLPAENVASKRWYDSVTSRPSMSL
jgi:glutathione S-transferase